MHSGGNNCCILAKHPAYSFSVGIASIILEGRSTDDEEDNTHNSPSQSLQNQNATAGTFVEYAKKGNFLHDTAQRINQKLQQIRACPGSSKDVVGIESIPSSSRDYEVYSNAQFKYGGNASNNGCSSNSSGNDETSGVVDPMKNCTKTSYTYGAPKSTSFMKTVEAWAETNIANINGFDKIKMFNVSQSSSIKGKVMHSGSPSMGKKKTEKLGPKQGPHCQQFMKEIGMIKSDADDIDHNCHFDSKHCIHWQSYFKQLSSILSDNESICIEVYLGPEYYAILLEQWILTLTDKPSDSRMTIVSLCTAIRSQLYFSQISAWSDSLDKTDVDIFKNPRIKKGIKSASPKLDILFRIKAYDQTSCFNDKPNIHNFPDAIISENLAIQVCLKSLPRLSHIPRLECSAKTFEPNCGNEASHLLNDRMNVPTCNEKGKHRCAFKEGEDEKDEEPIGCMEPTTSDQAMSHREKQLLKYKKRLMKREKKKKNNDSSSNSSEEMQSSTSNNSFGECTTTTTHMINNTNNLNSNNNTNNNNNNNYAVYTSSINSIQPPLYSTNSIYTDAAISSSLSPASSIITATITTAAMITSAMKTETITSSAKSSICALFTAPPPPTSTITSSTATLTSALLSLNSATPVSTNVTRIAGYNKMTSIGTQTDNNNYLLCQCCGKEMQCNNCDKNHYTNSFDGMNCNDEIDNKFTLNKNMDQQPPPPPQSSPSPPQSNNTSRLGKGDLLLQAIERTANYNSLKEKKSNYKITINNNNNSFYLNSNNKNINLNKTQFSDIGKCERSECDNFNNLENNDCRWCNKRQKTKHNYMMKTKNPDTVRRVMSDNLVTFNHNTNNGDDLNDDNNAYSSRDDNVFTDDLNELNIATVLSMEELNKYRRAFSDDAINDEGHEYRMDTCHCNKVKYHESQFKTPENNNSVSMKQSPETPTSSNSCLTKQLYISCTDTGYFSGSGGGCSSNSNSPQKKTLFSQKNIPKINLSNIFNISPLGGGDDDDTKVPARNIKLATAAAATNAALVKQNSLTSSPIPIENVIKFDTLFPNMNHLNNIPVQKSNSAPSFNGGCSGTASCSGGAMANGGSSVAAATTLSPRFLRSATLYKRRSRHFSDRSSVSERSSIGSDEQLSDEEFSYLSDQNISPRKSPNYIFGKRNNFCKLPLLGTLEESLLQKRLAPKSHVSGFKILLGASGSFCPTQLTIPVTSYFYELHGQTLTTPYLCEARLPRKGYSIPRVGTVQTTLLNPLGTVVRMFVVSYDFRDMPEMSTTFIRQRILACDETMKLSGKNMEQLSSAEQMKHLRYVIHLRFQTSRSGRLLLHTDIKLLISRRTDCDTAAAHANSLESPNELKIVNVVPDNPKFSIRIDKT